MVWESPQKSETLFNSNSPTLLKGSKNGSEHSSLSNQIHNKKFLRGTNIPTPLKAKAFDTATEYDYFFKIVVVGPANSGKTSLIRQYCSREFYEDYDPTFGMQNKIKKALFSDTVVQLSIWDTPSDERFRPNITFQASGADAIVFVYDSTDQNSLTELTTLLEELYPEVNLSQTHLCLISTKKDKKGKGNHNVSVPKDLIAKYNLQYLSISARSPKMVEELFEQLIETLRCKQEKNDEEQTKLDELYLAGIEANDSGDDKMKVDTPKGKDEQGNKQSAVIGDSQEGYEWHQEAEDKLEAPPLHSKEGKTLAFQRNVQLDQRFLPEPDPHKYDTLTTERASGDTSKLRSRHIVVVENEDNNQQYAYPDTIAQKFPHKLENSPNPNRISCCSKNCNVF
mgnify:FL=1